MEWVGFFGVCDFVIWVVSGLSVISVLYWLRNIFFVRCLRKFVGLSWFIIGFLILDRWKVMLEFESW